MKALTLFLVVVAVFYTSSVGAVPISPENDVYEYEYGKGKVFYCRILDDALFIAVQEEESLALGETDREFVGRIGHLVSKDRCTVDFFLEFIELEILCQWYGVVVEEVHQLGRKYIIEVTEREYAPLAYFIITEGDPLLSKLPPTVPQCSFVKKQ